MTVSKAIDKMIAFYEGSIHDIEHFLKVWAYARSIGQLEGLDGETQQALELAAVAHDIACPLCREKYGSAAGPYQEAEGAPMTREFYGDFGLEAKMLDRICYLVGHHHSPEVVDGEDFRILLEADFLVNAWESRLGRAEIERARSQVFKTKTGIRLLEEIYRDEKTL